MLTSFNLRSLACCQHRCRGSRESRRSTVQCVAAARPSTSSAPTLTAVAAAAAAACIQLSAAGASFAAPAYDFLPGFGGETQDVFYQAVKAEMQRRGPDLEDMYDGNLMTDDLRKFVDSALSGKLKPEQYQSERLKLNFRRELDGRVSLRSREGKWFSIRSDMQVPGFMLLRDDAGGVYFLPPDEQDGLAQLDLSDDIVVAELFSNTAWQDVMSPFAMRDDDGKLSQLRLSERDFRELISLVEDAEEPPEQLEPAAQAP